MAWPWLTRILPCCSRPDDCSDASRASTPLFGTSRPASYFSFMDRLTPSNPASTYPPGLRPLRLVEMQQARRGTVPLRGSSLRRDSLLRPLPEPEPVRPPVIPEPHWPSPDEMARMSSWRSVETLWEAPEEFDEPARPTTPVVPTVSRQSVHYDLMSSRHKCPEFPLQDADNPAQSSFGSQSTVAATHFSAGTASYSRTGDTFLPPPERTQCGSEILTMRRGVIAKAAAMPSLGEGLEGHSIRIRSDKDIECDQTPRRAADESFGLEALGLQPSNVSRQSVHYDVNDWLHRSRAARAQQDGPMLVPLERVQTAPAAPTDARASELAYLRPVSPASSLPMPPKSVMRRPPTHAEQHEMAVEALRAQGSWLPDLMQQARRGHVLTVPPYLSERGQGRRAGQQRQDRSRPSPDTSPASRSPGQ